MDDQEKHRMAEHSKERFDFHQARKAEEKAQEEQRRAERAALAKQKKLQTEAATAQPAADDVIKAALARVNAKKAAKLATSANPEATTKANEPADSTPATRAQPPDAAGNATTSQSDKSRESNS